MQLDLDTNVLKVRDQSNKAALTDQYPDINILTKESREKLEKLLYSISASSEVMGDITKEKNVLVVRDVKKFSKLKVAYILAKDEDEIRENGGRSVSLKEIYEAITMSEGGH